MPKDKRQNILSYLLPFASLILSFVAISFAIAAYKQNNGHPISVESSESGYLNLLIAIIGIMFAFSAISIYSVFNANIDQTKDRLFEKIDIAKKENNANIEAFKPEIDSLTEQLDNLKIQTELLSQKSRQYNLLFLITSSYTTPCQKESAVMELLLSSEQGILFPEIINESKSVIRNYVELHREALQSSGLADINVLLNRFLNA